MPAIAPDPFIWLVPGGDINPGLTGHDLRTNYTVSAPVLPPSMAICYQPQKITKFAVHLLSQPQFGTGGWPTATRITVYSFCLVDQDTGIPVPVAPPLTVTVDPGIACICGDLGQVAGCTGTTGNFLAVSFNVNASSNPGAWTQLRSWGISVTLGTNDPLIMP